MKRAYKILWWKSPTNSDFYFHIVAGNGRIVAQSEGYKQKASMLRTIDALKKLVGRAQVAAL